MCEDSLDFLAGQHGGWFALGVVCDRFYEGEFGLAIDFAGEEDHRIERLLLGGR